MNLEKRANSVKDQSNWHETIAGNNTHYVFIEGKFVRYKHARKIRKFQLERLMCL